jgi:hypothetical protein
MKYRMDAATVKHLMSLREDDAEADGGKYHSSVTARTGYDVMLTQGRGSLGKQQACCSLGPIAFKMECSCKVADARVVGPV